MDAVTYQREMIRMCRANGYDCDACPLCGAICIVRSEGNNGPEEMVAIVEQWSKEHPLVTNGDKVWEMIPGDVRSTVKREAEDGFPISAPCSKDHYVITVTADWWDAEYKGEE